MTPIVEEFAIGAYWGSCAEPLSQIAKKTIQTLKGLREIDKQWFRWYRGGINKETDMQQRVFLDEENVKKLCLSNAKKGGVPSKGLTKSGYIFNVTTGPREGISSGISFIVGSALNAANLRNSCVIHLPNEGPAKDRLLQPATTRRMLRMLVRIWRPDYAVLTSRLLRYSNDLRNEVGWTTFKREIDTVPELNGQIAYERDEQGHWFTVEKIGDFSMGVMNQLALLQQTANPVLAEFLATDEA
jgi:hypothetical protein